jgi:hypothetical protein
MKCMCGDPACPSCGPAQGYYEDVPEKVWVWRWDDVELRWKRRQVIQKAYIPYVPDSEQWRHPEHDDYIR